MTTKNTETAAGSESILEWPSHARALLVLVWDHGRQDSWERFNTSMHRALNLAISAGLTFDPSDFKAIYGEFRGSYWVGAESEWIYRQAILHGNQSAYTAWEAWLQRKPFFGNEVDSYDYFGSYSRRIAHYRRQRSRLAVGFSFPMEGRRWFVTNFDDEHGRIRVACYAKDRQEGKPQRLITLTHADLQRICPAPKKAKPAEVTDET